MDSVEIGTLTTYESANDGVRARLNVVDAWPNPVDFRSN
jgi:hypothetical protein